MDIDTAKKKVSERLEAFIKSGQLEELRNAASLIDSIEPTVEKPQAVRSAKLALWLALFEIIDAAKDPKFDPEDVPAARVTVPPGTSMKPDCPVVTPECIADPAARKKYDESVEANAVKTDRYRTQKELRQLDSELTLRADAYIKKTYGRSPESLKEMTAGIDTNLRNSRRAIHFLGLVAPLKP
ncbi:MAG: hypothetical protein V2I51_20480 [Anderseniella sp.]|jgi:hypothetical protein|nr:hypothetical protein [Anderseniella sp.]RPI69226.1 MAG: hypothetical protein EHM38_07765 [Geobacteraceae bacterium]